MFGSIFDLLYSGDAFWQQFVSLWEREQVAAGEMWVWLWEG